MSSRVRRRRWRERILAAGDGEPGISPEGRSRFGHLVRGLSKAEAGRIVDPVLAEEGRPPESVFGFVQGIVAVARSKSQQDARLVMEGKAKVLLESLS